jgi:hypothetical protein
LEEKHEKEHDENSKCERNRKKEENKGEMG